MKIIILLIIQWLAVITANITFLWGIIEFILYLVKDKEFNWWSVWGFVIACIVAFICAILAPINKFVNKPIKPKKTFKERIEEYKNTGS